MAVSSLLNAGERLVVLALVFASSFRLLLTLQTGANIVLSLFNFSDHASFRTAALKTLQCAFKRLVLLNTDFSHGFPSLRVRCNDAHSGPNLRPFLLYAPDDQMSSQISSTFFQFKKVKNFHQDNCKAYLIIRLISLFLTTMALMSFPPSVRALCTFSLAIAASCTAASSESAGTAIVPRSLPLI